MADIPTEMAEEMFNAIVARARGTATLALAVNDLDLDEDQAEVLDIGISAGIGAVVLELRERKILHPEQENPS